MYDRRAFPDAARFGFLLLLRETAQKVWATLHQYASVSARTPRAMLSGRLPGNASCRQQELCSQCLCQATFLPCHKHTSGAVLFFLHILSGLICRAREG